MDLYSIRQKLNKGIPLNLIPLKVTYYSRVSTDHLEQQKSLKNQNEHFDEMIKSNKNWTYIEGYIDEGISGTTDHKRTNFMRMINDAENGKFDLIITKEISRFSRNTLDSIKYTRELLSYGVAVLFVNDNINTVSPDSELRLTIMASMAQDEIRRLSERVKFGMNRSIKNGTILGNNMLYGYRKNKNTGNLIIIEKEASLIKRLFSLYAIDNYSITKIAKIFNNENIKTCQNKKWCPSTLIRMLKNPKYKGYYCGKKTEVIDYMTKKVKNIPKEKWIQYEDKIKVPPIIEEELWERANNRLESRHKTFGKEYKMDKIMYQNRYPLSAKIYCANHNEVFHRRKQCKATNDITWTCAKYLRNGVNACNSPNIRQSEIYYILEDILIIAEINLTNTQSILTNIYKSNLNHLNIDSKIIELEKEKNKIIMHKNKLLELILNGIITDEEFNIKNNEYIKELTSIDENINILKQSNQKNSNINHLNECIKDKLKSNVIKERLINLILDKIITSKINNNKDDIELKLFFKKRKLPTNKKIILKKYEFKRGYNTTNTRRYIIKYNVKAFIS